jgi:hypothetical protein
MSEQSIITIKLEIPTGGQPLTDKEKAEIRAELNGTEIVKIAQGKAGEIKAEGTVQWEMEVIDKPAL